MKQSKEEKIKEKGYQLIEEYAINNIISRLNSRDVYRCLEEWMPELEFYYESADSFHKIGGSGYKIIQRCLKHFKDYKFVNVNSEFRFQREEYVSDSGRIKYLKSENLNNAASNNTASGNKSQVKKNSPIKNNPLMGTKADIYYLLNEADQNDYAARRCKGYINSSKLHLTAILTFIIETTVQRLMEHDMKRFREYGIVIYEEYMNPDNDEKDMEELYKLVGMSKKKFYNVRGEAISIISKIVFGILPGEMGFSKFYIKNGDIVSVYDEN